MSDLIAAFLFALACDGVAALIMAFVYWRDSKTIAFASRNKLGFFIWYLQARYPTLAGCLVLLVTIPVLFIFLLELSP